jgi:hypothetical protein
LSAGGNCFVAEELNRDFMMVFNNTQVVFLTDALSVLQALMNDNLPQLEQALYTIKPLEQCYSGSLLIVEFMVTAPPFVVAFVADPSVYTLTHDSEGYFYSSMLIVRVCFLKC